MACWTTRKESSASTGAGEEVLVDVPDLDTVSRVRTYGSAGINRPWAQLAGYGDRIKLPMYGGTFQPTPGS